LKLPRWSVAQGQPARVRPVTVVAATHHGYEDGGNDVDYAETEQPSCFPSLGDLHAYAHKGHRLAAARRISG